jgi:3-hydroxyisobutyrate dehydrogenase-like beta-hydroxyacid dehydrogenase
MGSRMAKRLLDAEYVVTGYNRTKSKAQWLLDAGMQWAPSPRAVAATSEVMFTMLRDTAALYAVTRGPDGLLAGLGPGKIYVDMSTVAPTASRELAAQVEATGAKMVDAPVSGSVTTLEEGKLSIMVGGDQTTFERIVPILRSIGPKVTYVGGNGQAVLMKIATNLSLAVQMLAFSEGMVLAERGGIRREIALEVLLNSVIASPMLRYRAPFVLQMPEEAWFDVTMMQKDMQLALELGRQYSVPLPTTAVTDQMLTAARSLGHGNEDFAAVFEVLVALAGLTKTTVP